MLRIEIGMRTALIRGLGVDAACSLMATGSDDKTVRLWSLPDGHLLRTIRLQADSVRQVPDAHLSGPKPGAPRSSGTHLSCSRAEELPRPIEREVVGVSLHLGFGDTHEGQAFPAIRILDEGIAARHGGVPEQISHVGEVRMR